jgi:alpha-L-rhamnosidase
MSKTIKETAMSHAKWIGYYRESKLPEEEKYGPLASYFRKRFVLGGGIVKAALKISALGWFRVFLNGTELSNDEYFLPGWTDYRKRVPYRTYDIKAALTSKNAVGIVLGNGWANGSIIFGHARKYYALKYPRCLCEIAVEYEDGSTERIGTDKTWKASAGEILYNDIMYGEYIDKRKSLGDFTSFEYDDTDWRKVLITGGVTAVPEPEKCEVTKVVARLSAKYIGEANGEKVYDLGQNIAGISSGRIRAERGTKIIFRHAEMLNDDSSLYTENLRDAEAKNTFVASGAGWEEYRPSFTFHGFRYIGISADGEYELADLKGLAVSSELMRAGRFSCSEAVVNQIYKNAFWGQRGNFINVPTDCPQRDERLGWTGDAQVFCKSAMYNMDCRRFFEKYIYDMIDTQNDQGDIAAVAPSTPEFLQEALSSAAWSDAIVILPYWHYQFYRDKAIIHLIKEPVKKYLARLQEISVNYRRKTYFYGDWLSVDAETDGNEFDLLFYGYINRLFAELLKEISEDELAVYYREEFEKAKNYFCEHYMDKQTFKLFSDTQTVYLLAYRFGFMRAEEIKQNLLRKLEESDFHLTTGFIGVSHLLPVLCEIGESELAYRIITQTDYPSWGYSVVNGATTVWERWNSYTKESGFGDKRMNSFNHYALGSCVEWLYENVLGIKPNLMRGKAVTVSPYIDTTGKIVCAEGEYAALGESVSVSWHIDGGMCEYNIRFSSEKDADFVFDGWDIICITKDGSAYTVKLNKTWINKKIESDQQG